MNSSKTAPQVESARHRINGERISSPTGEVLGQYSAGGRVEANPYQLHHKGDRG
jgi:hypothetical protein